MEFDLEAENHVPAKNSKNGPNVKPFVPDVALEAHKDVRRKRGNPTSTTLLLWHVSWRLSRASCAKGADVWPKERAIVDGRRRSGVFEPGTRGDHSAMRASPLRRQTAENRLNLQRDGIRLWKRKKMHIIAECQQHFAKVFRPAHLSQVQTRRSSSAHPQCPRAQTSAPKGHVGVLHGKNGPKPIATTRATAIGW